MNAEYLLQQLVKITRLLRRAQKEYYACRADRKDPIKAGLLSEAQRREQDLDKLLIQIDKVYHIPTE